MGNSMPIRDLDMYSSPALDPGAPSASSGQLQGVVPHGVGAPVGAHSLVALWTEAVAHSGPSGGGARDGGGGDAAA